MSRREFTEAEVRVIKANLVKGVSIVTLAQMYECNPETISRMKRGLTHRNVKVVGEEKLRPEIKVVAAEKVDKVVMSGVTDEEAEQSQKELLERLAQEVKKEKAVLRVDEEVQKEMARYGY